LPPIYKEDFEFKIGKGITIQDGSDVVVISSGSITRNVLDAVEALETSYKLSFKIIDMHTISPIDKELLNQCMTSKLWITVEEHFVSGGLGSVIAEFLSDKLETIKPNLLRLGIKDKFSIPGDYNYLIETNELDAQGIVKQITECIRKVF